MTPIPTTTKPLITKQHMPTYNDSPTVNPALSEGVGQGTPTPPQSSNPTATPLQTLRPSDPIHISALFTGQIPQLTVGFAFLSGSSRFFQARHPENRIAVHDLQFTSDQISL